MLVLGIADGAPRHPRGAVHERERSGLGRRLEANLVQGFAALDTWAWFLHLIAERWPEAYEAVTVFDDDGVPASPFPYMLLNPLTKDGRVAAVRPGTTAPLGSR